MDITKLEGQLAKLYANSIKVYDDNAKMVGIIKASRFTNLPPRVTSELWKQVKASGLWDSHEANHLYYAENTLWYLYNTNPDEYYLSHCVGKEGSVFEEMARTYEARQRRIENAEAAGVRVVRFQLLG